MKSLVPTLNIASRILLVRGLRVMLDSDLAVLYRVETKALKRAVRRNPERFPDGFMLHLTWEEALRCQSGALDAGRGRHRKYRPYAFTEQGVAMLSSVLRSRRAIQVNIEIMKTFVRIREVLATRQDLAKKIAKLERVVMKHDKGLRAVFVAIWRLMAPPRAKPRRIGFVGAP